ncbi:hypothetical protein TSUD_357690 [Trifolium subterraneum]|uniref:Uncharacterized protein n=1 Tax=Trifolium subterraneum TaxID=3900 RepID=A0A2Z6MFU0_TRISU|nr:hypothetical protein TSUD_357690 [Trifolium subterraneum]
MHFDHPIEPYPYIGMKLTYAYKYTTTKLESSSNYETEIVVFASKLRDVIKVAPTEALAVVVV